MSVIIYITERCNMACEYCYQAKDRAKHIHDLKDLTKEEIDARLQDVKQTIGDKPVCFVLFGGEPLLRPDLVEYIVSKAEKIFGDKCSFNMSSNGTLLLDSNIYQRTVNLIKNHSLSLDISYDGSGHSRRIYLSGKPTESDVVHVLHTLDKDKVPYRIRYTIHKGNYLNSIEDWTKICLAFSMNQRIIVSFNYHELCPLLNTNSTQSIQEYYIPIAEAIWDVFHMPVCELNCRLCRKCQKYAKYNTYVTKKKLIQIEKDKQGDFNHFTLQENQ